MIVGLSCLAFSILWSSVGFTACDGRVPVRDGRVAAGIRPPVERHSACKDAAGHGVGKGRKCRFAWQSAQAFACVRSGRQKNISLADLLKTLMRV